MLVAHFLSHFWERHRRPGATMPKFSRASLELLRTRTWPGNVRELQNVIQNVAVLTEPAHEIQPDEIPLGEDPDTPERITDALTPDILREGYHAAKEKLNAEFERVYLRRLVERSGGNLARAARAANVDRTTLYRLLEKHSIGVRRDAAAGVSEVIDTHRA
jgi:DNA-binding NtrC family response regulator